ncbi:MAG TPA: hypothetical protein PKX06_01400, partial [Phenylobacterium sp.]|nr:hypothetical protein [Phenylobacterium sp.]
MKRTKTRLALGSGVAALLWAGLAQAQEVDPAAALEPEAEVPLEPAPPPAPEPTLSDQIAAGRLLLEVRARYEGVDQTRTAMLREDGQAFTVRTRLGWET